MKFRRGEGAAKSLGEFLLDRLAASQPIQALHVPLCQFAAGPAASRMVLGLQRLLGTSPRLPRMTGFRMPNNDLFLFTGTFTGEVLHQMTAVLAEDAGEAVSAEDISDACQIFAVPDDAIPLRRLIKTYLVMTPPPEAEDLPSGRDDRPGPATRTAPSAPDPLDDLPAGQLTLDGLKRLQALFDGIDLEPFIQRQMVYRRSVTGWTPLYLECFFNIGKLRQLYFPSIELQSNDGLFIELCRNLDDLMLVKLLSERAWRDRTIGLNLTLGTLRSPTFADFSRHLSAGERASIVCELHWAELLHDIQDGGAVIRNLAELGYRLAIDRIGIRALPYLDLKALQLDYVKVRFERTALSETGAQSMASMRGWPRERIVLTECEDDRALALGEALGVVNYQGHLLDRAMARAG